MQRVVITGCAGSGKSTLGRQLAARTGLPLVERAGARPAGAHRPQGLAALSDPGHPVRWAWTSHAARRREGVSLMDCPDLAGTPRLRLTRPVQARRWLRRMPNAASPGATE